MSYIAFDLDALNAAPAVARAAGLSEESVIAGLVRMWAWCFREKTDRVSSLQVRGHFGADACEALVAFGFLGKADGDLFRVRGADRYLRVSEARSRGGKAASGNLKRGQKRPPKQPKVSRDVSRSPSPGLFPAPAGEQPESSPGSVPALTPNTEHRTPNLKTEAPRETDLLCEDFKRIVGHDYRFEVKDGVALAELKKTSSFDEIRRRWGNGLRAPQAEFDSCRSVAELRSKWNRLGGAKWVGEPKGRLYE